ncbi:SRPBCC family protein [uncultured Thiothrix sp.]|uniref:SRPBCC family protein n=1 Tax=uncultured Thiothrix sp. TaxID=223185 RepID=UPI00261F563F|nr:SRPBCC family protein [uncultured Thiothrix sp.]
MIIEHSIITTAKPETVFAIYAQVDEWKNWDPDTKASYLSNGLTLGSQGKLTPTKGNTVPMEVTAVVPHQSFTVTSKIPLFKMVFDHELTTTQQGTRITHRVQFSGLLSFVLGKMLGKQVDQGLPITLQRLKELAESLETKG